VGKSYQSYPPTIYLINDLIEYHLNNKSESFFFYLASLEVTKKLN